MKELPYNAAQGNRPMMANIFNANKASKAKAIAFIAWNKPKGSLSAKDW